MVEISVHFLQCIAFVSAQSEQNVDPSIPVSVSRRPRSDVYYYNNDSTSGTFCDNENFIDVTYLVSERSCIKNKDLFSGI